MYKLCRQFTLVALLVFGIAVLLFGWFYQILAIENMERQAKSRQHILARTITNRLTPVLHAQLTRKLKFSTFSTGTVTRLDIMIRELAEDTNILRIRVFDHKGKILYSPDRSETGKQSNYTAPPSGPVRHELKHERTFSGIFGQRSRIDVLKSYIPFRLPVSGIPVGMIEFDTDVTRLTQNIASSRKIFMGVVTAIFFLIFTVLIIFIRYANSMIQKQNEDNIHNLHELKDLNQSLQSKTDELREMRDKALAASKSRSALLANMSHELRTPLNAIIGYSEILLEENLEEQQASDINKIHQSGHKLLDLINNILELAKLESGKIKVHHEEFHPALVIEEILDTAKPLAEKNNNRIIREFIQDPGIIRSDVDIFRQVLLNIVSNACKFTRNGEVSVIIDTAGSGDRKVLVMKVCDTGIGMSEEQVRLVFEPFHQVDASSSRRYEGGGLGLSMSRRYCDVLQGTINIDSTPDEGTCVEIRCPCSPVDSGAEQESRPLEVNTKTDPEHKRFTNNEKAQGRRRKISRILVVDPDPHVIEMATRQYTDAGFHVKTVRTAEEGISAAGSWEPDVITVELSLPGMNGLEFIDTVRSNPALADRIVIAVSMTSEKKLALDAGADEYVAKPVNWEKLCALIIQRLRRNSKAGKDISRDTSNRTQGSRG